MSRLKEKQILVVIKEPGQPARVDPLFDNTLEAFQAAVGGWIETVTLEHGYVLIVNEEGRLRGLPYNVTVNGLDLVGPVICCRAAGDEFASLKGVSVPAVLNMLGG